MNEWIKITPDALPPDMKPVLVTVEHQDGERQTLAEVRYNHLFGVWEELADSTNDFWSDLSDYVRVTHWAYYPQPAQD